MSDDTAVAVSVDEAGRRLGVGRTTIYALIARGKLRSFTVGDRRLIAVSELVRFAERQTATQNVTPVPPTGRVVSR